MFEHKEFLAHTVSPPLYLSASWTERSVHHQTRSGYSDSRVKNPAFDLLHEAIQGVYGSSATLLCPSGMSAISCALHGLIEASKHMILVYHFEVFPESETLLRSLPSRYPNLRLKEVDLTSEQEFQRTMEDLTSTDRKEKVIVFTESCTNPHGKMPDTSSVAQRLREAKLNFEVIVDNSWLSALYNPFEYGADVVVESLSKYVGGGDVIMGMVTSKRPELLDPIRTFAHTNGIRPSPYDCHVCLSMINTLQLRLGHVSTVSQRLAKHLQGMNFVKRVSYPLLPSHPTFPFANKVLTRGGPGVLCFCLDLTIPQAVELMDNSSVILFAPGYGRAVPLMDPRPHHTHEGTWLRLAAGYGCTFEKTVGELDRMLSFKFARISVDGEMRLPGHESNPSDARPRVTTVQKRVEFSELARFLTAKGFPESTLERVFDSLTDDEKRLMVESETIGDPAAKNALARGWLSKQEKNGIPKRKWCIVECGVFKFYEKETDDKPEGLLTLSFSEEALARELESNPVAFNVSTGVKKKHTETMWYAATVEDRMRWVACLVAAINGIPDKAIGDRHQLHELTMDMMVGLRCLLGRNNNLSISGAPNDKDFGEVVDMSFPKAGSKTTPPHPQGDFGFKDYCPSIFRRIRAHFGIETSDYLMDVCGTHGYLEFVSNSKSGEFFFHSHNRKYMIKTISHNECRGLRHSISTYYNHMMTNPHTLMNKFFGLHKVKPSKGTFCWFLIMGSIFPPRLPMHLIFDLKGSTYGRSAKPSQQGKPGTVYKDNDFVNQKISIDVGSVAETLKAQLTKDVKMLEELKIIDYSVLCGIHFIGREPEDKQLLDKPAEAEPQALEVITPKTRVVCVNLENKEYNGQQGMLLANEEDQRCVVRLDNGEEVRIRRLNLRKLLSGEESQPPPPPEESDMAPPPPDAAEDAPPPPPQNAEDEPRKAGPDKSKLPPSPASSVRSVGKSVDYSGKQPRRKGGTKDDGELKLKDSTESSGSEGSRVSTSRPGATPKSVAIEASEVPPEIGMPKSAVVSWRDVILGPKPPPPPPKDEGSLFCKTKGGFEAIVGPNGERAIICLGIIDTLIEFGWKKKLERDCKANIQRLDKASFSVVEPDFYARRLLDFFGSKICWEAK